MAGKWSDAHGVPNLKFGSDGLNRVLASDCRAQSPLNQDQSGTDAQESGDKRDCKASCFILNVLNSKVYNIYGFGLVFQISTLDITLPFSYKSLFFRPLGKV
jgi:hypothetical protein